jgi:NTP pyrophosphatase (non-canonical NTP hydrolase)
MSESEILQQLLSKDLIGLRELQTFHLELDKEKQFDQDIFRNIAYLSGEIGELVSSIRMLRKSNDASEEFDARIQVGDELADCLAYIVKLANYAEVNLHKAYIDKMRRNTTREWHKTKR